MRTIGRCGAGGTLGNLVKIIASPQRLSVTHGTILAPTSPPLAQAPGLRPLLQASGRTPANAKAPDLRSGALKWGE